jgi:formylglycine-generating enzyme required for sulfatase activity
MKFLETLAGKLTAILAFAIVLIISLAVFGERIPERFLSLVYIAAIGAMIIFTIQILIRHRSPDTQNPIRVGPTSSTGAENFTSRQFINARDEYLHAIIAEYRAFPLDWVERGTANTRLGKLKFESLYIPLDTTTMIGKKRDSHFPQNDDENENIRDLSIPDEKRPLSALEALWADSEHHIVLVGLPGTGKSTFVRYLALQMAQVEADRSLNIQRLLPNWGGGSVLPIVISLGQLAQKTPPNIKQGSAKLIEGYLVETIRNDERMAEYADYILQEIDDRGGLLLFDGLDEVEDLDLRRIVVQALEDFVEQHRRQHSSRFLVTCRTYPYSQNANWQLTGWNTHELALFTGEQIGSFIKAWYSAYAGIERARASEYENKQKLLLDSLLPGDRYRLHDIASIPLILTIVAFVHTSYGDLPDTRAKVFGYSIDLLLHRWELERPVFLQAESSVKSTIIDKLGVSKTVLDQALSEIAYKAHDGRQTNDLLKRDPAFVTEELLIGVLNAYIRDLSKVQAFLEYCQSSNGLLMLQGSAPVANAPAETPARRIYTFFHPMLEEFLAAQYLHTLLIHGDTGSIKRELIQKDDRWREALIMLGEYLCFVQNNKVGMEILMSEVSSENIASKREQAYSRAVLYSSDLLVLYNRAHFEARFSKENRIRKELLILVTKERDPLSPLQRSATADTLDELEYIPNDLYAFIAIPNQNFYLAKYPITNAHYERFLKPENFANKNYWIDFPKFDGKAQSKQSETWASQGWEWLQKILREENYGVEGEERNYVVENGVLIPRYWRDPRFGSVHHTAPVVGISWYEANAYCKWLTEYWQNLPEKDFIPFSNPSSTFAFRLPLEVEWEIAAGGVEPNDRLAWGLLKDKKDITHFANTSESGIQHTTPVWMYPQGASLYGVMDMSGNVLEWLANVRRIEQQTINHRVEEVYWMGQRGGSWKYDQAAARVSYRLSNYPGDRFSYQGFRIATLPIAEFLKVGSE